MCYKNLFMEQPVTLANSPTKSQQPTTTVVDDNSPFFYHETDLFPGYDFSAIPSNSLTHLEDPNTSPMSFCSEYSPPGVHCGNGYQPGPLLNGSPYPTVPTPCYATSPGGSSSPGLFPGPVTGKEIHSTFGRPVYNGFTNPPEYAFQPHHNGATQTSHLPSFLQILQGLDCPDQYSPDGDVKFAVPPATSPLGLGGQSSLCKVCGDVASGNHFGVLSCEACKSFFRRSVRAGARYACRGTRSCSVEKHTRNRCQYCRLQKCVQMGMRKEAVQEERAPPVTKVPHRAGTPTQLGYTSVSGGYGNSIGASIPQLPIPQLPSYHRSFESPVSPVVPSNLMNQSRMFGSLPNLKMGFDVDSHPLTPPMHIPPLDPYVSHPMTPNTSSATPSSAYPSGMFPPMGGNITNNGQLDTSILVNADTQVDVPPETVTTTDKGVKLEDIFEGARQSLLRVIEWGKRIPAFTTLQLDDQVKLLKSCWCEHVLLKLATRIGPGSATLLLSSGITCRKEQIEDPEVRRIVERVSHEISYWFDVLHVDRTEMACLKGIILFNPDARGLSPGVRKKVEIFQEQILSALEARCKSVYSITPLRFSKLLLRLPPLRAAALEATQHMEVQRTLGNAKMDNIFGELLDFD